MVQTMSLPLDLAHRSVVQRQAVLTTRVFRETATCRETDEGSRAGATGQEGQNASLDATSHPAPTKAPEKAAQDGCPVPCSRRRFQVEL